MKFACIVSDPNWQYKNWTDKAHGAAISHYATSSLEELKKIPVDSWQADDCVHLMWCTLPKLPEGIELLNAWNLEYVTAIPWVKTVPKAAEIRRGIGFWAMSASEILLIGRKGNPTRKRGDPVIGLMTGCPRVFYAPIRGHSQKPEEIQDWAERTLEGPYLELFATRERAPWTCWGYSTGYKLTPEGVEKLAEPIRHR